VDAEVVRYLAVIVDACRIGRDDSAGRSPWPAVTAAPMGAGGGEEINTLRVLGKVALRRQSSTADPSSRPTADQPRTDRFSADSGQLSRPT